MPAQPDTVPETVTEQSAPNQSVPDPDQPDSQIPAPDKRPSNAVITRYNLEISGAPKAVSDLLKKSSQLLALKKKPPATVAALRRRIAADEERFRAALESEGYYDATLETTLNQVKGVVQIKINIVPGDRFIIRHVGFRLDRTAEDSPPLIVPKYTKLLEDLTGKPARAIIIIEAEEKGIAALRDMGYPFARRSDRETDIDHESRTVTVTLPVNVGPFLLFGTTRVKGLEKLGNTYMQRSVPWKTGTPFVFSELEELRKYYIYSGLFSSVKITPGGTRDLPDNAPLDIDVEVTEGARRSISIAGKYDRDKGFGGTVNWTHRNLLGNAEKLETVLDGTQLEQTATAAFTKPNFLRRNQALKLTAQLKRSDTDAFTGYSGTVYGGLEREWGKDWVVGAGISFDAADLSQGGASNRSYLAGLPITVTRAPGIATRAIPEAFVDQTEGWRMRIAATPYVGSLATAVTFFKGEAEGDFYFPLDERRWYVVATRLKLGTILGAATDHIPADKRFYSGGGGSVRGFGYQLISPLDATGTPIGGRSLIEAGVETRIKVTETIGVVPFVDIGAVSRTSLPGQNARFAMGAGIGGRYYTGVGPLRVDFAVPLNPRGSIDKGFQFYLSFGQAF
jgi:translocation and assembly module TamA